MEGKQTGNSSGRKQVKRTHLLGAALSFVAATAPLLAQHQNFFVGSNATGQLTLSATVTLLQQSSTPQNSGIVTESVVSETAELHATARIAPERMRSRNEFAR